MAAEATPTKRRVHNAATTTEEAFLVRGINSAVKNFEGKICCGGSFALPEKGIRIWYCKDEESDQGMLHLPVEAYNDSVIDELVAASTRAEARDDLTHVFTPATFATNFDLGQLFILDEIRKLLAPEVVLRAQLHQLLILETGACVDKQQMPPTNAAPEDDHFGYLVVALPIAFTGGNVHVSSDNARSHEFCWGGEPLTSVHWAAYVTGCHVEVTEVTSGYLLMLCYKLYKLGESTKRKRVSGVSETVVDPQSLPVYELLMEAIRCPKFRSDGAVLGYACQREYAIDKLTKYRDMNKDDKSWMLKGADAMLFAAAKAAGLKAELKPVYKNSSAESPALFYIGKVIGEKAPAFLGEFDKDFDGLDDGTLAVEELPTMRDGVKTDVDIGWCLKNFSWTTGKADHGNDVNEGSWCYSSALLLEVPSWEDRRSGLEEAEDLQKTPEAKRAKIYENAVASWFMQAEKKVNRETDFDYKLGVPVDPENGDEEDSEDDDDEDEDDDYEENVDNDDDDDDDSDDEEEEEADKENVGGRTIKDEENAGKD